VCRYGKTWKWLQPWVAVDQNKVRDLVERGLSIRQIAAALGIPPGTAERAVEAVRAAARR
jgi:hypothetical protein